MAIVGIIEVITAPAGRVGIVKLLHVTFADGRQFDGPGFAVICPVVSVAVAVPPPAEVKVKAVAVEAMLPEIGVPGMTVIVATPIWSDRLLVVKLPSFSRMLLGLVHGAP